MSRPVLSLSNAKSGVFVWTLMALVPTVLVGQEDPVTRLPDLLPPEVAERVLPVLEEARAQDLPVQAMANLALEGVAKGRSADAVLQAVQDMGIDLAQAQAALQGTGRFPAEGEVEATAAAMRMGVDGATIATLAQSNPSGRSLTVPVMVLSGLMTQGVSRQDALTMVQARLAQGIDDPELVSEFPEFAQGRGRGMRPTDVGPAHAAGLAGFRGPVAGVAFPVGPRRGPPDGLPGRGPRGQTGGS